MIRRVVSGAGIVLTPDGAGICGGLEFKGNADLQLIELKRKMGKLPPGEGAERPQLTGGESEDVAEAELVEDDDVEKKDT